VNPLLLSLGQMKILVRGTNWIGDAVMSIPALRELRRVFSEAHITLHTRAWADGLFRDASFIDDLVTFEPGRWKIRDVYDNSRFLRNDGYDLAIVFPNSFESAVTTFLSNIPRRVGYNRDVRGLLLTDPIPVPEWKNRNHEAFYYLNLIAETERRVLGRETVSTTHPNASIEVSDVLRADARQFLAEAGINPSKKIIALGVGSTNSRAKRWPQDRYADLADLLSADLGAQVILLGSESELEVTQRVAEAAASRPLNLAGQTSLAHAVAVLAVTDLLISNDMGLAHISAAVGTPTITIFGPTNPATTRPLAPEARIINHPVECSPCMLQDCPIDHRCMRRITVDGVVYAAHIALGVVGITENP